MMSINLNNIAILNIRGFDYGCQSEAVNLQQDADLCDKVEYYVI